MKNVILLFLFISTSCSTNKKIQNLTITDLADKYFEQLLSAFPQNSYYYDEPTNDHSLYGSYSIDDIKKWEIFQDNIFAELNKLDETRITRKSDKISYWLLKEELESSIAMRICKQELWNVSHMSGIHQSWAGLANFQPIGNDSFRNQAFKRWNMLPVIIENEIEKLNIGINEGYTMPKEIVELVINQIQTLTEYSLADSPFMSPAKRDQDPDFTKKWEDLVVQVVNPSFKKFGEYLEKEYLAKARTEVSILENPNGEKCYQAFIRRRTTTNKTGDEIFNHGFEIVNRNKNKIEELGQELYQSNDFSEIIALIKADSSNYFTSSDEILTYNNEIMADAKVKCLDWFETMPSTEVTIEPYLPHESGIGRYETAKEDKPAYFKINLNNPSSQSFSENEKLSFHEAYPGHHLQLGIEKDIKGLHKIRKTIWFGSYIEGWARYTEQLAEEMGLYRRKASLISRRSWPSRGMVIDPGLHLKNWSKESVINFMKESGTKDSNALSLYHRIIVWPAQLTSYDVGGEEIKALRELAMEKLGDSFDIKEFHTKILENGSIPLLVLRSEIETWIELKLSTSTTD